MEALSATQLVEALKHHGKSADSVDFDEDFTSALKILEAQKINGKRFLKLEPIDFSRLGIPYGVGMDLKGLTDVINEDIVSKGTPTDSAIEEEEKEDYSEIQKYFSAEDFDEMSDYDKKVHLNLKRNYDKMCLEAPNWNMMPPLPRFMKPKRQKTTKERDNPEDSSKPGCSKESSTEICSTGSATSTSGRILREKPGNSTTYDEGEDSLSEDDKTDKKIANSKPVKKMTEKDFMATLPSFDIDDILSKLKGKPIRELESELKKDSYLAPKHIKLLVRTLVLHLFCDREGNYKRDITAQQKEGLAASIVQRCPFLKDNSDNSKWTWWRVYDRKLNRGRIPNVISNLQRKLDPEDKLTNVVPSHSGSCANTSEEESTSASSSSIDDFSWLGLLVPSAGEHKQILSGMNQSFPARKTWIFSKQPTIHDILEKFPHLVSYNGELIEEEFKLLHPKINHLALLQSFPQFISKLKNLETLPSLPDNLSDDVMQGCLWLAEKMPWQNLKRFGKGKRGQLVLEDLVQIIPSIF
ncbi:Histone-lysine N-methyltransferase PRDM9 [Frankliniella fusca]|uniref:Histone-lysine N-methyltransferase PRDM9 n=1 Tax=Frankliniella fusca TaxID=407009 RepID=A0AAE1I641_9NEOP|nr:Histone-lysine N-methyltransferase PRDM9 [Frankliniella fusca]